MTDYERCSFFELRKLLALAAEASPDLAGELRRSPRPVAYLRGRFAAQEGEGKEGKEGRGGKRERGKGRKGKERTGWEWRNRGDKCYFQLFRPWCLAAEELIADWARLHRTLFIRWRLVSLDIVPPGIKCEVTRNDAAINDWPPPDGAVIRDDALVELDRDELSPLSMNPGCHPVEDFVQIFNVFWLIDWLIDWVSDYCVLSARAVDVK